MFVSNSYMANAQRLWCKARENRPSIYGRPPAPLVDRHRIGYGIPFERFREFFRAFVELAKPETPLNIYELHRCFALAKSANGAGLDNEVEVQRPNKAPVRKYLVSILPGLLVIRDIYLQFKNEPQEATEFALDQVGKLVDGKTLPFFYMPWRENEGFSSLVNYLDAALDLKIGSSDYRAKIREI